MANLKVGRHNLEQETTGLKFVFSIRVKPGFTVEEYAANWVIASKVMQNNPGAMGTRLYRDMNDPTRVLAIASWESREARNRKDDSQSEVVRKILAEHEEKCEFTFIGEFEDAEWEVLPEWLESRLPGPD